MHSDYEGWDLLMVGRYEMLAEPQRDITPEQAAARLRACSGPLYRKQAVL